MEMTKETLALLLETAVDARLPTKIKLPGNGKTAYLWDGNNITPVAIAPPLRAHKVYRLDDLIAAASRAWATPNARPVVWHSENGVVLIYDDEDRRDRLVFPLTFSEPWLTLKGLEEKRSAVSQRELIRMLRIVFLADQAVVNVFRRLEWDSGTRGTAEIAKGRDRLGAEIRAEVTGAADLPDDIVVDAPVYRERGRDATYSVRLVLDYDVANQRIEIAPMVGELDRIITIAQQAIRDELVAALGAEFPIYYGTP